jgi:hypothetical protein
MDTSNIRGVGRVLCFACSLLWLVASAVSAKLVDWLYIEPAYGMHWSSFPGALLLALVSIFAGGACIMRFVTAARGRSVGRSPRRSESEPNVQQRATLATKVTS